jgi:hypothetical protein
MEDWDRDDRNSRGLLRARNMNLGRLAFGYEDD